MRLLVIDGNSIANRAFFGIKLLTTKDGRHTNAVFGFLNILLSLIKECQPDEIAVAFDLRAPTFRHKMYSGYKANRHGMPEELAQQMPLLKELLQLLGYRTVSAEGWEADDILGTLAAACAARKDDCFLATGDRDSLQLVSDTTTVLLASAMMGRSKTVVMDVDAVQEKYGVSPRQLIEVKSLMGDTSDNIPGVKGIGEKTALNLIQHFGTMENVYAHLDDPIIKPKQREHLIECQDLAQLSHTLGTIRTDAPVDTDEGAYRIGEGDRPAAVRLLRELENHSLIPGLVWRTSILLPTRRPLPCPRRCALPCPPSLPGVTCWLPARLSWANPAPATWSCSRKPGMRSRGRRSFPWKMQTCCACWTTTRCSWTYSTQLRCMPKQWPQADGAAASSGMASWPPTCWMPLPPSTMWANWPDATRPRPPLSVRIGRMPAAWRILFCQMKAEITALGEDELYNTIEFPLAQVLADMTRTGMLVDRDGIESFGQSLRGELEKVLDRIHQETGSTTFNPSSPKQLGEMLFDTMGLPHGKKTQRGWSTDAETLEALRGYPLVDDVLQYRTYQKLNSTYVEGLLKVIGPDGRIHSTFNQTEARTGRLSSDNPNLQNIPIRTELGSKLRAYFVARPGWVLVDADYSQIELRILAHITGDEQMQQAFLQGEDIHRSTAAKIYGLDPADVTPRLRSSAKAINFGIMYGKGAYSLSKDIGVSVKEADDFLKSYLAAFPKVSDYMDKTIADAKANGYVSTLFGRRRALPELSSSNFNIRSSGERMARNTPIQGTAADVIKLAMVRVWRRLRAEGLQSRLILTVHDELIVEAPEAEAAQAARILQEEMEGCVQYAVPLSTDVHQGKNWLEGPRNHDRIGN